MASSIYAPWSVVAGEQPTTAKWNILGTNDGSFNTGQGFNDGVIISRHITNNYKFFAYRNSSFTTGGGSTIVMDAKLQDTGSNFSVTTGLFTAPITGSYEFSGVLSFSSFPSNTALGVAAYKNGSVYVIGDLWVATYNNFTECAKLPAFTVPLNAGDTMGMGNYGESGHAINYGGPAYATWFCGKFVSL